MESVKVCALAFLLFIPPVASAQISCFTYYGGVLSCDSSIGNTTITPLNDRSGVITQYGNGRNTLEPYTVIGAPREEPRDRHRNPYSSPSYALPNLEMPGLELPSLELPGLELP